MIRALLVWPVKVGVIAAALWYVLRDPLPAPADWIVAIVAGVLLHLAYAAVMTDIRRGRDARLLQKAGFGEPPADGQRVALVGTLKPTAAALRAPFSQTDCVGYSYEIFHFVYTPSRQGTGTNRKVTDFSGLALAPCSIHTMQGDYALLSYPYLSGFSEQQFSDEAHRARAAEYIRANTFDKTTPIVGELAALDRAMHVTDAALKRDWRMTGSDDTSGVTMSEQCIPADAKVCAFGIYSEAKRSLVPDTASDSRSLLLIAGDAEQALAQLGSGMQSSRTLASVSFALAASLVGFILFAPWNAIRAVPGGTLIVDKQTERLKDALWKNDVGEVAAASRYLDPNLAFEEASRTPLMLARSPAAAEVLIRRGANVTAHDENGYSVLMNAAERGSPELLTFLVAHGADVNEHLRADAPTSVLSIAKDRNRPAAVEALVNAGARE
jgi:Ankyrin repeat